MAQATCSKCGSTLFETKEITPRGASDAYSAIQCIMCGAVAGIVENQSVVALLQDQNALLSRLAGVGVETGDHVA